MTTLGRTTPTPRLTPRQHEVLALLRRGYTNDQIAGELNISLDGAKWHVSEIIGRLGVSDRYEAARWRAEGERRPWWSLVWLRELRWTTAATAASGAAIIIVALGAAALAWGVWRAASDDDAVATGLGRSADLPSDTLVASTVGGTIAVNTKTGVVQEIIISGLAAAPLAISPDGTRIAFVCNPDLVPIQPNGTGNNLCAFDAATSAVTIVVAAAELPDGWTVRGEMETFPGYAAWSPDGSKLAFAAYEPPFQSDAYVDGPPAAVYIKDLRSGELRSVSDAPGPFNGLPYDLSWSADGSGISIVEQDGEAAVIRLRIVDTATGTAWTLPWPEDGYTHVWSPDGSEIAINNGVFGIVTVPRVDPSEPFFEPSRFFSGNAAGDYPLVWSPDGQWILANTRDYGMIVVPRDGRGWHRVGDDLHGWAPAAWSPDGKRVAFVVYPDFDSPPYEPEPLIYVADTSGADPREVVALDELDTLRSIAWSGDGERLFYTAEAEGCGANDCGPARLFMVPIDGSAPARELYRHPVIDILPQHP